MNLVFDILHHFYITLLINDVKTIDMAIPSKQVFKGHLTDIMSILVSRFL